MIQLIDYDIFVILYVLPVFKHKARNFVTSLTFRTRIFLIRVCFRWIEFPARGEHLFM